LGAGSAFACVKMSERIPPERTVVQVEGWIVWKVGSVREQSDFVGFNIIDATSQRPIVTFSYSGHDEAINAHGLVAKALENAKHVGVVPPRP
jgi:hypothetical protein